ncbi:amiloride-sensitive sodium channel subunit gamma-like [Ptychodera flava]|uniref:amiloride-sensitive sodium channel subunit gamma-like n=1 Tax=Ptychodera flava TaxID=63121 RepID=UPI00396A7BD5
MEQSQDRCCLGQEAKNKYKVLLGNVMTNSTVHGLPNIRRAQSVPKRIFWSISFLTAVGLFIGFSSTLIKHYFEYEVDVSVSVTFERDLAFPAVTICNLNPLRKSLLTEMQWTQLQGIVDYSRRNNRGEVASANGTFKNETGGNSSHQQSTDYNQWDNMDETFHTDSSPEWWMNKQIEEYLAQQDVSQRVHIGHQIDDMLITCRWSNRQCSPKNFTHHLDIMYGNCYTFNGGGKNAHISTNFAGPTHGLTLELFVEQDEYLDNLTHSAGIRVAIHPPGQTPFPEDTGFDVEPGTLTSVGIRLVMQTLSHYSQHETDFPRSQMFHNVSIKAFVS